MRKSLYDEPVLTAFIKVFGCSFLRKTGINCVGSQFYHFFFRQYMAALRPGRIPVTPADHPLDKRIPFLPSWAGVYLDFVGFWVRVISFLAHTFGSHSNRPIKSILVSISKIYASAAEVYSRNLSTTERPFYITRPRFFFIHLLDPHLLCIPSLHVMVVINAFIQFRDIMRGMGKEDAFSFQIEELRRGALAITESLLYVKQHSINCVAAAMYAMTRLDERLFPPEEAEVFGSRLFSGEALAPAMPKTGLSGEDAPAIRGHILSLYRRFVEEGRNAKTWDAPLLDFLRSEAGRNNARKNKAGSRR